MKRHSTWETCTKGLLKVKWSTIVITKQLDEECHKDVEENSTHTGYHAKVEVKSNLESSKDEQMEAP